MQPEFRETGVQRCFHQVKLSLMPDGLVKHKKICSFVLKLYIFLFFVESRGFLQTELIESLVKWTKDKLQSFRPPLLHEIATAASLANHGVLGSVESVNLKNVDLASVPAEHLASLASCVTVAVGIINVSNTDLSPILDNIKIEGLSISSQTLSSEETRALVRAMESGVECVRLGAWGDVYLDITALTQYSGQGKCREVWCDLDTADRYGDEVTNWAKTINWTVDNSVDFINSNRILIKRL